MAPCLEPLKSRKYKLACFDSVTIRAIGDFWLRLPSCTSLITHYGNPYSGRTRSAAHLTGELAHTTLGPRASFRRSIADRHVDIQDNLVGVAIDHFEPNLAGEPGMDRRGGQIHTEPKPRQAALAFGPCRGPRGDRQRNPFSCPCQQETVRHESIAIERGDAVLATGEARVNCIRARGAGSADRTAVSRLRRAPDFAYTATADFGTHSRQCPRSVSRGNSTRASFPISLIKPIATPRASAWLESTIAPSMLPVVNRDHSCRRNRPLFLPSGF